MVSVDGTVLLFLAVLALFVRKPSGPRAPMAAACFTPRPDTYEVRSTYTAVLV